MIYRRSTGFLSRLYNCLTGFSILEIREKCIGFVYLLGFLYVLQSELSEDFFLVLLFCLCAVCVPLLFCLRLLLCFSAFQLLCVFCSASLAFLFLCCCFSDCMLLFSLLLRFLLAARSCFSCFFFVFCYVCFCASAFLCFFASLLF